MKSALATLRTASRRPQSRQMRAFSNGRRVSEVVKYDHQEIESDFYQILDSSSEDSKTRFRNQFVWELARHTVAEELLLYPAFEKHLENGKVLADRDRQEHRNIKVLLRQVQDMKVYNPHFIPTLKSLMRDLSLHMREEEATDLPALEQVLSEQESENLSAAFQRTKLLAPSRSHPMGPNKPPFETAYGLVTAPIDLLGDLFRKFPRSQ